MAEELWQLELRLRAEMRKISPHYTQIEEEERAAYLAQKYDYTYNLSPDDQKVYEAFDKILPPNKKSAEIKALCKETGQSFDDLKRRYEELEKRRLPLEKKWKAKEAELKAAERDAKKAIFSGDDEAAKQLVRDHYDAQLKQDIRRARTDNSWFSQRAFRKALGNDREIENIFERSVFDVIARQAKEIVFVTGEPLPEVMKGRLKVAGFTEQKAAPYIRITEKYAKKIAAKAPKAEPKADDPAPAAEAGSTGGELGGHPPEPKTIAPEPPREAAAAAPPPPPEIRPAVVEPPAKRGAASPPPPHEPVPPQGAAPEAPAGEVAGASPSAKPETGPENGAREPRPQRVRPEVTPTERSFVSELLHERPLLAGGAAVAAVAGLGYLALHDKRKEEEKQPTTQRQV